ncbi:hypothetical protein MKEN_01314000 [Mycena kentingensis (nom. inval.)]|nr:hypothetical protein MKEN_01314000 [Mycena kentingensis (nom. inval.)]
MASLLSLPAELVDAILLSSTLDKNDLKSLSLTHPSLRSPAQRLFLGNLTIACDSKYHPCKKSSDDTKALFDAPDSRLGEYAKHLKIDLRIEHTGLDRLRAAEVALVEDSRSIDAVQTALRCMLGVKSLAVLGSAGTQSARSAFSDDIRTLIFDFVRRSTRLRRVSVSRIDMRLPTLCPLLSISAEKSVIIEAFGLVGTSQLESFPVGPVPGRPAPSGSLDVVSAPQVYELLLTPSLAPFASSLRRLSVYTHGDYASGLWALCTASLEELHLCGVASSYTRMTTYRGVVRTDPSGKRYIRVPPSSPNLRTITLTISAEPAHYTFLSGYTYVGDDPDWVPSGFEGEVLDRPRRHLTGVALLPKLLSVAAFPALQTVTLRVLAPTVPRWRTRHQAQQYTHKIFIEETAGVVDAALRKLALASLDSSAPRFEWEFEANGWSQHVVAGLAGDEKPAGVEAQTCVLEAMPYGQEHGLVAVRYFSAAT